MQGAYTVVEENAGDARLQVSLAALGGQALLGEGLAHLCRVRGE